MPNEDQSIAFRQKKMCLGLENQGRGTMVRCVLKERLTGQYLPIQFPYPQSLNLKVIMRSE
jgi:hypothetical protein